LNYHWSSAYSVGIAEIDLQHRELLEKAATLLEHMEQHHSEDLLTPMVEFLEKHIGAHYTLEEGLMLKVNYPDTHIHISEHQQLLRDFTQFKKVHKAQGSTTMVMLMMRKIVNWFLDHFVRDDIKLGLFVSTWEEAQPHDP
jgi:hemerythrin-like metal-binding protein